MENPSKKLPKTARLTSRISVKESFEKGRIVSVPGIRIYYLQNFSSDCRVLVSIPKRLHKKAVVRNLLKRRIKEAYRLNRSILKSIPPVDIAILYLSSGILDFGKINSLIINVLGKIKKGFDPVVHPPLSTAD